MAVAGPPIEVEAPGYEPGSGGLISTFKPIEYPDTLEGHRWELGYQFRPKGGCGRGCRWSPCSTHVKLNPDLQARASANRIFRPFVIEGPYECSTFGTMSEEVFAEFKDEALAILERDQSLQLEYELWYGTLAAQNGLENLFLTGPTVSPLLLPGESAPALQGLAALQAAIRRCNSGSIGVIHAPIELVTKWISNYDVGNVDGALRDSYGNYIIAGAGYTGSAPAQSQSYEIIVDAAAGDWTITIEDPINGDIETTGLIPFNATAAQVQVALAGLSFADSNMFAFGGPAATAPIVLAFAGSFSFQPVSATVTDVSLAGGAATVTMTEVQAGGSVADPDGVILWAYATGLIDIRLGSIEYVSEKLSENFDRSTNDVLVRAERYASAAWDGCCHFGIPINVCQDCCEGA